MSRLKNNISALGLFAGKSDAELKDKLLDLAEEMNTNIAKLRALANGCSDHKSYRGYKKPTAVDCDQCDEIFESRAYLGE